MHPNPARALVGLIIVLVGLTGLPFATETAAGAQDAPVDPGPPMVAPEGSDLPVGFLDGIPVGDGSVDPNIEDPAPDASAAPQSRTATASRTPLVRYLGQGVWDSIRYVAAASPRPCSVSADHVTAMMIAPIFKESSASTTASTSPSPMTLARADEWTRGVYSTTNNVDANYGLYEGRNPDTAYQRAYWHPGIGIWQYDSAGVGAPFTAIERMDIGVVGADVAKGMINRYCASSATTAFGKRRAAWSPWMTPCTTSDAAANLCEQAFQDMVGGTTPFDNIRTVPGVSATGGALKRTCKLGSETVTCWYIDAARAQGSRGWTFNPDGTSPDDRPGWATRPTPLSFPFYVLKRNGQEERHWIRADTGYPVDISAKRMIGKNARPRSGTANVGSGLTWTRTSPLCDTTANRGNCGTTPTQPTAIPAPSGVRSTALTVRGELHQPFPLDLKGDGRDDIFWYGPGSASDAIWFSTGPGTFRSGPNIDVRGTYEPIVLDANGDGRDDILWYAANHPAPALWISRGDGTFTAFSRPKVAGAKPLVIDSDGDGRDELFWFGPGAIADEHWFWSSTGFGARSVSVRGVYEPFVADFDGNGRDDIFWHAPGSNETTIWLYRRTGGTLSVPVSGGANSTPSVGDVDGDGVVDIVWYRPGPGGDSVWFGAPLANFARQDFELGDDVTPTLVDLQGDGRKDVVWRYPSGATHLWTRWSTGRTRSSVTINGPTTGYRPFVGTFGNGSRDGLFWYGPGSLADAVWWN